MKKNLTKKLMLSVLTLAFAVVSLGASTFAWFTIEKDANVQEFNAQVVSGAGIEIAVGSIDSEIKVGENGTLTNSGTYVSQFYLGTLPESAMKNAIAGEGADYAPLNNVSTAAKTVVPGDFDGTFYQKSLANATEATKATSGYYAFKLYVRSEETGFVELSNFGLSEATTNTKESWAAGVQYFDGLNKEVAADQKVTYSVLSAARIGFVCEAGDNLVYQDSVGTGLGGNSLGLPKGTIGALEVYNDKYQSQTDEQLYVLTEADIPAYEKGTGIKNWNEAELYLQVTADQVYEIEVYIWIDGYDAECYNAIFSQILMAQFSFTWHTEHDYNAENKCNICGASKPASE